AVIDLVEADMPNRAVTIGLGDDPENLTRVRAVVLDPTFEIPTGVSARKAFQKRGHLGIVFVPVERLDIRRLRLAQQKAFPDAVHVYASTRERPRSSTSSTLWPGMTPSERNT